jgi:hypothetical protein
LIFCLDSSQISVRNLDDQYQFCQKSGQSSWSSTQFRVKFEVSFSSSPLDFSSRDSGFYVHINRSIPQSRDKCCHILESEPFQSAYSPAEVVAVSQVTVLNGLHNLLGMKNFHVRLVPHQFTNELQATRPAKCLELLSMPESLHKNNFRKVVTADENWFYLQMRRSTQWSVYRHDVATKTKLTISTPKFTKGFRT